MAKPWVLHKGKEQVIRCRIEPYTKELFYRWCEAHDTDPSKEIRKFVENVAQWQYEEDMAKFEPKYNEEN